MMKLLNQIDFGDEAGDNVEPDDLASYFVTQPVFDKFLDPKSKLRLAVAKKGVGKSALLQWARYQLQSRYSNDIIIKCRGADLTRGKFGFDEYATSPNDAIHNWRIRICSVINRELARNIKFAFTDDEISLVESAEIEGFKERNIISCLLERFEKLIPEVEISKKGVSNEIETLKRVNDRRVWILVDDLDATFQTSKDSLLELSTFFSACTYLTQDIKDIRFRITLRTDVWPLIRRFDESLDKINQYVDEITWHENDFRKLLSKRIETQAAEHGIKPKKFSPSTHEQDRDLYHIGMVFSERMIWAEKTARTYRVIHTLSYQRPRWAIQLCKLAQKNAELIQNTKIGKDNIDNVWGEYGRKRIEDLIAEHKHQCREIEELTSGFRGAPRLFPRDELLKWINNRILNHMKPSIEGSRENKALPIAHYMFRIGFLQARSEEKDNYQHFSFDQMPDFLTGRTDADFGVSWEIHPCYREALDIQKINRAERIKRGLIRKKNSAVAPSFLHNLCYTETRIIEMGGIRSNDGYREM